MLSFLLLQTHGTFFCWGVVI